MKASYRLVAPSIKSSVLWKYALLLNKITTNWFPTLAFLDSKPAACDVGDHSYNTKPGRDGGDPSDKSQQIHWVYLALLQSQKQVRNEDVIRMSDIKYLATRKIIFAFLSTIKRKWEIKNPQYDFINKHYLQKVTHPTLSRFATANQAEITKRSASIPFETSYQLQSRWINYYNNVVTAERPKTGTESKYFFFTTAVRK